MAGTEFYDTLETRDPEQRRSEQLAALVAQIDNAKRNSPVWAERLADVDGAAIDDLDGLGTLPRIRKTDLADFQKAAPPLGGLNAVPVRDMAHIFMSPGNIFEPDSTSPDQWRFGRALFAAGVRKGDIIHNTYSYHLTPAGMSVESAARALGCPVFPGGVGNTELQVQAMAHIRPNAYGGTPSFLKILLDKAAAMGLDVASLTKASVGAEPLPASLRKELIERGVFTLQSYGTADLGMVSYESEAMEGMIIDEGGIVEIVDPANGVPVADGEVGEITVTTFNPVYPLFRFATGDLSAIMAGPSPCGRTNMRIAGWLGRADQSTKVRGMFAHPKLVADVMSRHPEIAKARLVLTNPENRDTMVLRCEISGAAEGLAEAVVGSIQTVMKLRGEAEIVEAGSLPDDGLLIDDQRSYD